MLHSTRSSAVCRLLGGLTLLLGITMSAHAVVKGREGAPMAASLLMVLNAKGGVCSGIVVAPAVVMTAGHCVAGQSEIRVHYRDNGNEAVLIPPQAVTIHPEYRANAAASRQRSVDMALLRMPEHLSGFTSATLSATAPRAGETVTIAGFGAGIEGEARSTGTLRSAELEVVEPYGPGKILLWASGSAAGNKGPGNKGAGACQGDSGGAMVNSSGHAAAVASWSTGPGTSRCGALTQGTLIGAQSAWIDKILESWGAKATWFTTR